MEYDYEPRYCFRLIPLQICCKLVVISDILLHFFICGFFIKLATYEMIFIPFGVVQLMITLLSILFYIGIINESDKLMIPMIVAKVIIMLMIGTVTILAWIAFILSLFSLIHLESPIKRLSTSTYLGLQSIVMSVCLIILILEGSIIHAEYKYIKKQMDQRNADEEIIPFVNSNSLTMKPTSV
ncbi:Ferric reduction oxidase 3 [Dirofilaria immitis]|nr:hypothetical protein [Dirofilaria immitis]